MNQWKKVDYFQKGLSHIKNHAVCQDSVRILETDECLIAALSDGLGSLRYSEIAASVATKSVCSFFEENNTIWEFQNEEDIAAQIIDIVEKNINKRATEQGVPIEEMDCTLVFVCIFKKDQKVVIGRLGDSAICVITDHKSFTINDGNKTANATNAVMDNDAIDHLEIKVYDLDNDQILGFILTSDGLENELYMKGSDHVIKDAESYFNFLLDKDPEKAIKEKIKELTEHEATLFDDDISIAILSRADKAIRLPEDPTWLCKCGFRNNILSTYCCNCNQDFSKLYRKINFKEHGGKIAYFTEINKDPVEERKIVGLPPKSESPNRRVGSSEEGLSSGDNNTMTVQENRIKNITMESPENVISSVAEISAEQHTISPSPLESVLPEKTQPSRMENEPSDKSDSSKTAISATEKPESSNRGGNVTEKLQSPNTGAEVTKKKHKPLWLGIFTVAVLVVVFLAAFLVMKVLMSSKITTITEDINSMATEIEEMKAVSESNSELISEIAASGATSLILENGNDYWGSLDENDLPHGMGILLSEDTYYIGKFVHGLKEGIFIVWKSDGTRITQIYKDDVLVVPDTESSTEENEATEVTESGTNESAPSSATAGDESPVSPTSTPQASTTQGDSSVSSPSQPVTQ